MKTESAWDLVETLRPRLKAGDLVGPHAALFEMMRAAQPNPYSIVLDLEFTNNPADVAAVFDDFVENCCEQGRTKLLYTEMNGFTINTDLWFFDPFGFANDEVVATNDFGEFDYHSYDHKIALTGMEELQSIYEERPGFKDEADLAAYIVVSKFQQLLARSAKLMQWKVLPIYADGHDFDCVARVN